MFSQLIKLNICRNKALRFLYHDFEASFYEDLLSKVRKSTINVRRLRSLCIQICKTLNDLNPIFTNVFKLKINEREVRDKYKFNFPKWNQKDFVYKSLKSGTIYYTTLNPLKSLILSKLM